MSWRVASLANNLKSWNNKISTKSRRTIQIQEQTKPKQNKATIFEERGAQAAVVPFNNIQNAIFSVPVCYSERSSKYLERRRGDETRIEQWDFGSVMASVHLAPPALCTVCRVMSMSPVGLPPLVESRWGLTAHLPLFPHPISAYLTHTCSHTHSHTGFFFFVSWRSTCRMKRQEGLLCRRTFKYFPNNLVNLRLRSDHESPLSLNLSKSLTVP